MEFREDVSLGMKHPLSLPLMSGGGCCRTIEEVRTLSWSIAVAIVIGSFTKEQRDGNPGDVWWVDNGVALNSLGMPNGGKQYLVDHLAEMVTVAHDAGKALIVSIAGSNTLEYCELTETCLKHDVDAIELNLGCPNIVVGSGRKPIASLDMAAMGDILFRINVLFKNTVPFWVKVSPYSDPELLKYAAGMIRGYSAVKAVTAINTFPNAYGLGENGKSVITVGLADLSGHALKYIGLGQIRQWHDALRDETIGFNQGVKIIAVGGISTGSDVYNYGMLGASAFQMTTALLKGGKLDPRPLERVISEYLDIGFADAVVRA